MAITSGKVPLEKTLYAEISSVGWFWGRGSLHEKTGFSTCTITDDDQLSANGFGHCGSWRIEVGWRWSWIRDCIASIPALKGDGERIEKGCEHGRLGGKNS